MQSSSHIVTTDTPTAIYLQTECPSWRPTNSVRSLNRDYELLQALQMWLTRFISSKSIVLDYYTIRGWPAGWNQTLEGVHVSVVGLMTSSQVNTTRSHIADTQLLYSMLRSSPEIVSVHAELRIGDEMKRDLLHLPCRLRVWDPWPTDLTAAALISSIVTRVIGPHTDTVVQPDAAGGRAGRRPACWRRRRTETILMTHTRPSEARPTGAVRYLRGALSAPV